jgi:hypothetical protein
MSVQGVKDTFYTALRDRVAANNAARTIVVRGVVRPSVLVVENELPGASIDGIPQADTFCMRWTSLRVDVLGLINIGCEIRYATDGSADMAGMDRGRALAAMDGELRAALGAPPQRAEQLQFVEASGGGASNGTDGGTHIFWSEVSFGPAVIRSERMERTATLEVFGYE